MSDTEDAPAEEAALRSDRRRRHRERERAAGFTRCIVRCHVDDVEQIKAYAASLIQARKQPKAE